MGVVYYGRYYEYFEAGRSDMLRKLGYPYVELEKKNLSLPVIESYCKYLSFAKYDDLITIKTSLRDIPTVRIKMDYEIHRADDLVVSGYTRHAFVSSESMKPVRPPEKFIELIKEKI